MMLTTTNFDEDAMLSLRRQRHPRQQQDLDNKISNKQQHHQQHRLLQPVLVSLSLITFILLFTFGPLILDENDNKRNEVTTMTKKQSSPSHVRSVYEGNNKDQHEQEQQQQQQTNALVPPSDYYKQFYEYHKYAQPFHLYRNPNGQIHVLFHYNNNSYTEKQRDINANTTTTTNMLLRTECTEVSSVILNCSNDHQVSYFDIFTVDDANKTASGYPTILYTGIDGAYYHIQDITWAQDQSEEHQSLGMIHCNKVLGIFQYCDNPVPREENIIHGVPDGIVIAWIVIVGIVFLIISILFIRQCCYRIQYRKRMIREITSADIEKYSEDTYGDDDCDATTEMFDFRDHDPSEHDEIDPTELREVDLSEK
jgi:hypothetical protein